MSEQYEYEGGIPYKVELTEVSLTAFLAFLDELEAEEDDDE